MFHRHASSPPRRTRRVLLTLLPVAVLLALTLVVGDLIAAGAGLVAVFAAIAWLGFEMYACQRLEGVDDD